VELAKKYNLAPIDKMTKTFQKHVEDIRELINDSNSTYNGNVVFTYVAADNRFPYDFRWKSITTSQKYL
jgi:hypothetical protein